MSVFKVQMLLIVIFAVCGTTFTIIGPKILGKATTEIANGLMSKVSGGSGMDFEKDWTDPAADTCIISGQHIVLVYSGISDDGGFSENNIPFAKRNLREDQSYADELF